MFEQRKKAMIKAIDDLLKWAGIEKTDEEANEETGSSKIEHFVVICMENRSFDSLLGWWAKDKAGIDGIPAGFSNTDSATGKLYPARPNATFIQTFDAGHELDDTTCQLYGFDEATALGHVSSVAASGNGDRYTDKSTKLNGFVDHAIFTIKNNRNGNDNTITDVETAAETVMSSFDPANIPVTIALAEEFALFDAWHAGIPGPTFPNRVFLASATSNGMHINNNEEFALGLPQKSVFQMFHEKGLSFKNYYGQAPTGLIFDDFRKIIAKDALELNPFKHTGDMTEFKEDCAKGTLPTFSWIDPIFVSAPGFIANDNHPPHDVARGEALIKEIYEAIRASPQWSKTALLLTYDEHGGFADHVRPPVNVPIPDAASAANPHFHFDRLGLRVPAILISPYVKRGLVIHDPIRKAPAEFDEFHPSKYDHSSLCHTMNDMFDLGANLNDRAKWSGSFANCFSGKFRADCPITLPDAPPITEVDEKYDEHSEWTPVFDFLKHLF
ncbi:hypothetical protein HK100_003314 [Physocladia obscura]|uniref:Phosphoesterase n=1 Tax=Physocladia obscura TaxID=109957 RepID=A0AAD5X9H2_9FUNG|nr:hypothetical protein HK100_003314 [Physocladia obscura]